ncbi:MAG: hypothetical protein WC959_03770 [Kiritimatiellales bacterium]
MKKFLKFSIGILLLPLCWAFSKALIALLASSPAGSPDWTMWALPAGFLISVGSFFVLPRPFRAYVLGHELSHALWGVIFGAKVGRMKVGKNGGHVMLSKTNFIISLAPYFFPFYTFIVIALWALAGLFVDLNAYRIWWLGAVGLTWGFHLVYTIYMLSQPQPDVKEHGRFFSYIIIFLMNLFFVALWMIVVDAPTFHSAGVILRKEVSSAYLAVWRFFLQTVQ